MFLAMSGHDLPLHFRQRRPESPPNVLILLDPGLRTSGDTVEDELRPRSSPKSADFSAFASSSGMPVESAIRTTALKMATIAAASTDASSPTSICSRSRAAPSRLGGALLYWPDARFDLKVFSTRVTSRGATPAASACLPQSRTEALTLCNISSALRFFTPMEAAN